MLPTPEWVAWVMFIGPKPPTAYVVEEWQPLQSVPLKAGMCGGESTADFGLSLLL